MESILFLFSFALNPILLSGLIIPQVQRMKELKDQMTKFQLHFKIDASHREDERTPASEKTAELRRLLDVYKIRSKELRSLLVVFYVSIAVAVVAAILLVLVPFLECFGTEYGWVRPALLLLHTIVQLLVLIWAMKRFAVNPDRLRSLTYLVQELDLNPHALFDSMDLRLRVDAGTGLELPSDAGRPLKIYLETKLPIFGFRIAIIITSQDETRAYYFAFGPVDSETKLWRHLLPPIEPWLEGEKRRFEIGEFSFNSIVDPQTLSCHFLAFPAYFPKEEQTPLKVVERIPVYGPTSPRLLRDAGGANAIGTLLLFGGIHYYGEGTSIRRMEVETEKSDTKLVAQLMKQHEKRFMQTRSIVRLQSIEGRLLQS